MNYAVIKIVNGNFTIDSEWPNNLQGAIKKWHDVCGPLWNAQDVQTATVMIIDQQGNDVPGYKEFITHTVNA